MKRILGDFTLLFSISFIVLITLLGALRGGKIEDFKHLIIGLGILCLLIAVIIIWVKIGLEKGSVEGQKHPFLVSQIRTNFFKTLLVLFILLLSLLLSVSRMEIDLNRRQKDEKFWSSFTNRDIKIEVLVSDEPVPRHDKVSITGNTLSVNSTKLLFDLPRYPKVQVGDICLLEGNIKIPENFSDFDYKQYLANKRVYRIMRVDRSDCKPSEKLSIWMEIKAAVVRFKTLLISNIDKNIPEPQSSLLAGIVFGQQRVFSEEFGEAVKNAGVSHVVAASGYNISFVVGLVSKFSSIFGKKNKVFLDLFFVWLYCLMAGLPSSIVRAGLMFSIAQLAKFLGLKIPILNVMVLTLASFMLIDPKVIHDVGFQLFYLATLGLIYLLPLVQSFVSRVGLSWVSESIVLPTLACTVTTLPVTVLTFGKIPVLSILVNALVLPVIDSVLMLGVAALLLYYAFPGLSQVIYIVIWFQLKYFEAVVSFFGKISWATISF